METSFQKALHGRAPANLFRAGAVALAAAGVLLGYLLADAPLEVALVAGVSITVVVILVNLWAGFLIAGVFLLIQAPIRSLTQDSPDLVLLNEMLQYTDDVLIVLLGVAAVWHARHRIAKNLFIVPAMAAVLAALGLGLSAALLHSVPSRAIPLDAFSLTKWAFVLFAGFQLEARGETLIRLMRGTTLVAAALALFGYFDMMFPGITHETIPLAGPVSYRMGFRCLISIFPNEGYSGWFFAAMACLPFAGYLVLRRPVDLALAALLIVSSFLSYRRKPVLGIAFALFVLFIGRIDLRGRGRILLAATLIAFVVVPILGTAMWDIFEGTYDQYIAPPDPMRVARNALYIASWQIARDYFPLGAGLGLFGGHASTIEYSEFYARYGLDRIWGIAAETSPSTPNFIMDVFFPHVLGALGLVGGSLYMAGLVLPGWKLNLYAGTARSAAARIVVIAAMLVFFEALAESIASPVYEVSLSCFVVFGLAGLALSHALTDAGSSRLQEGRGTGTS